jgi:D-alanyl-D-alanine carboxypeptidase/D-alanyl-D-alanine-endopeptidase (penicillin-binding protein 4)
MDLSYFDALAANPSWPAEDARFTYQPPLSPLSCEHNVVILRVVPTGRKASAGIEIEPRSPSLKVRSELEAAEEGQARIEVHQRKTGAGMLFEVSGEALKGAKPETLYRNVSDPAWFTGLLLKDALKGEGILLRGKLLQGETVLPEAEVVATHRSLPLADLLRTMNKESDNLYAEQLLKTLGAERYGPPGSADKGIQAVKAFLDTLGVKPEGCRMADGSGLSRANSLSAEVLVGVLAWMHKQFRLSPEFVSSLPVAGGDGTLGKRLSQFPGLSRAKTGTLTGVSSLAGYAVNKRGGVVAFAILVNGYDVPAAEVRGLQDEMVKRLTSW